MARGVRFNIRLAITADSYEVGILKSISEEGLDQVFGIDEGSSRVLAARGRMAGMCILIMAIRIPDILLKNLLLK